MKETLSNEQLEPLIFSIRGHQVLLDADLARVYGVTTKRFNEAFKRNRDRFPDDFAFQLSGDEFEKLRSQFAISSSQAFDSSGSMWSQFATTSAQRRRATHRPWAFTEHGALMAANILRSERAVQMSVFVVGASVRLREHVAAKYCSNGAPRRDRQDTATRRSAPRCLSQAPTAPSTSSRSTQAPHRFPSR